MKKVLVLLILVGLFMTSCTGNYREQARINAQYALVDDYQRTFQLFCLNKFDGDSYSGIFKPDGITKLKHENPSLYELEIRPIEILWDSLLMVNSDRAQMNGMSESMMKYKDKSKSRIKVKKSDNVTINMNNEIIKPDTLQ